MWRRSRYFSPEYGRFVREVTADCGYRFVWIVFVGGERRIAHANVAL